MKNFHANKSARRQYSVYGRRAVKFNRGPVMVFRRKLRAHIPPGINFIVPAADKKYSLAIKAGGRTGDALYRAALWVARPKAAAEHKPLEIQILKIFRRFIIQNQQAGERLALLAALSVMLFFSGLIGTYVVKLNGQGLPAKPVAVKESPGSPEVLGIETAANFAAADALAGTAKNKTVTPSVSADKNQTVSQAYVSSLIDKKLDEYTNFIAGFLDSAAVDSRLVSSGQGQASLAIGGTPLVSYVQPVAQNGFGGGSIAGFTSLSADKLTAQGASVGGALSVSGLTSLAGVSASGTVTASKFIGDGSGLTGISSSQWVNASSSGIYYSSGNVGISTSTPAFALDVNGTVNASALYVNGAPYIGSQWTTAGSNIYYSSGNVGIGTASPSSALTVVGDVKIMNSSLNNLFTISSSGPNFSFGGNTNSGLYESAFGLNNSVSGGYSLASGYGNTASGGYSFAAGYSNTASGSYADALGYSNTASGGYSFAAGYSNTASNYSTVALGSNMNVSGSGSVGIGLDIGNSYNLTANHVLAVMGGNVGIGTTTPGYKMTVAGDINFTGNIYQNGSLFGGSSSQWTTSSSNIYYSTGNVGIGTTGPVSALSVIGDGYVSGKLGIGITNPSISLHALTKVAVSNIAYDIARIELEPNGTTPAAGFGPGLGFLGGSDTATGRSLGGITAVWTTATDAVRTSAMTFSTVNSASYGERMRLTGAGNLGIGTTSATSRLVVQGSTSDTSASALSVINSGGTSLINILNNGNVGIGTTNPTDVLNVVGNVTATSWLNGGAVKINNSGSASAVALSFAGNGSGSGTGIFIPAQFNISFATGGSERMRIDSNGNVGIGTTSPQATLHVNGSLNVYNGAITYSTTTALTTIDNLQVGGSSFETDAGILTWIDMPVTASSATTTILSYTAQLGGSPILTVFANGDGAGGIQNAAVGIGTSTPTRGPLTMASGAYVTTGGVWTNASDKNLKENFVSLDPIEILQKIDALNIQQWNYKAENASTTHIGPVAQDFYAQFHLGGSDTSVSTIDPAGVALLGLQGFSKILGLQGNVTGNLSSTTPVTIARQVNFAGDTVGQAKILAGALSVRINFDQPYQYQPIITITPLDFLDGAYRVTAIDAGGFTIELQRPQGGDAGFDWHAFGGAGARLTVSDGAVSKIILVAAGHGVSSGGSGFYSSPANSTSAGGASSGATAAGGSDSSTGASDITDGGSQAGSGMDGQDAGGAAGPVTDGAVQ